MLSDVAATLPGLSQHIFILSCDLSGINCASWNSLGAPGK